MANRVTKTSINATCNILKRMLGMDGLYIDKDAQGYKLADHETGREYTHRLNGPMMQEALLGVITGVELATAVLFNARRVAFAKDCGIPIHKIDKFVKLAHRAGQLEEWNASRKLTDYERKALPEAWEQLEKYVSELNAEFSVNIRIDTSGLYPHCIRDGYTFYIPYDER